MKTPILALVLAVVASQATALSCIRPNAIQTFQRVAAAPEGYYVLYGQLSFDETELTGGLRPQDAADPAPIEGHFTGKGLTLDGFTSDFVSPAELRVTCAGPWCGSAQSGVDAIYFVRAQSDPVVMTAGPCGGMIFERPSPGLIDALTSCMQGGTCLSAQPLE